MNDDIKTKLTLNRDKTVMLLNKTTGNAVGSFFLEGKLKDYFSNLNSMLSGESLIKFWESYSTEWEKKSYILRSGLYFFFFLREDKEQIPLYVGKSKKLLSRFAQHLGFGQSIDQMLNCYFGRFPAHIIYIPSDSEQEQEFLTLCEKLKIGFIISENQEISDLESFETMFIEALFPIFNNETYKNTKDFPWNKSIQKIVELWPDKINVKTPESLLNEIWQKKFVENLQKLEELQMKFLSTLK